MLAQTVTNLNLLLFSKFS